LRKVKTRALESFNKIKEIYPKFDRYKTSLKEIEPFLDKLDMDLRKTLMGNLTNRDLTQTALKIFEKAETNVLVEEDKKSLGKLIYTHHVNLSKNVGISTEKVDSIVDFCMSNGAYGAKINGSGFGGTLFAYCPTQRDSLISALKEKGFKYFPVEISTGAGEY
jgi:galactokinase